MHIRVDANDFGFYRRGCEQFLVAQVTDLGARQLRSKDTIVEWAA